MTIIDIFHSLIIVKKISILDVAGVLDPTLITDIFAFPELIVLKPIYPSCRNRSININCKEHDWLL